MRIRGKLLLLLLIFLTPTELTAQQPQNTVSEDPLLQAEKLVSAGRSEEAKELYRSWLGQNRGAESFADVFLKAAGSIDDIEEALKLLKDFTPSVADAKKKTECLQRQVLLLKMLGRIDEALAVQQGLPPDRRNLYDQALLLYDQGMLAEAEAVLKSLLQPPGSQDTEMDAKVYFLLAQVYIAGGRMREAEAQYVLLRERYAEASISPAVLLGHYEVLREKGAQSQARQVLEELQKRFPDSPEYLLALRTGSGDSRIRYAPNPGRLLSALRIVEKKETSYPDIVTDSPAKRPVALVQTGSFRDPENAQYMVSDLQAKGFAAYVVEKLLNEIRYYRVVIGPQQSPEQAQMLLTRLKDAGFEGVLLFPD